jgi:DNA-damage-inducible protein J
MWRFIMSRTAELKVRIDPVLKQEAAEVYGQWGLNLTDAVTIFLSQSVATGGLPFSMRVPLRPTFDRNHSDIIHKDPKASYAVLPSEWDAEEDSVYDNL